MDVLIKKWHEEEMEPFSGWDFSYLNGRMRTTPLPWSYESIVSELMDGITAVLDMVTGGGERLLDVRDAWPPIVKATEGYEPNLKLAREHLGQYGVEVVYSHNSDSEILPFDDNSFDLVLNRHGAINVDEVKRVLKENGRFLTQQVDGMSGHDLIAAFYDRGPQWPDANIQKYRSWLERSGFIIEHAEVCDGQRSFTDVGAIVYYLKAIPWLVEGFSVEEYLPRLQQLQARLDAGQSLAFSNKHYLIQARK